MRKYGLYDLTRESFEYDSRNLLRKYTKTKDYVYSLEDECEPEADQNSRVEWQYWYNPMKEREQKRLYYSPTGTFSGSVYPWEYYLLGGKNEQFAVYKGIEMGDNVFRGIQNCSTGDFQCTTLVMPYANAYFFPAEYNSYGAGASVCLSLKTDENAVWKRHYNITDQLGNTRLVLREDPADPRGFRILGEYNYEAYGRMRPVLDTDPSQARMRYIGKERDEESLLADHGVRKYDYDLARFTCPDPMWEKYYSWTPYQYALNNPIRYFDNNGLLPGDLFHSKTQAAHDFGKNYNPISITMNREFYTTIYSVSQDGENYYTYKIPQKIGESGGQVTIDSKSEAIAHTHGAYDTKYDSNNMSVEDETTSERRNIPNYVATPDGSLKKYDPNTNQTSTLTKDMPRDKKDPEAKNNKTKPFKNNEGRNVPYIDNGVFKEVEYK